MEIAAVFLPLVGAIIAGFFGRQIGDRGAQIVTCTAVILSTVLGCTLFWQQAFGGASPYVETLAPFIHMGSFQVDWALRIDTLSTVMLVVVGVVSSCVHVYSIGYMDHDDSKPRFMAYLSLFTFMMLMLVTADNLVQLFFGWEGVGVASYLLIGFWYKKPSANKAAIKAFIVNRVGDFGLALGIFAIFYLFGSVNYDDILQPERVEQFADTTFLFLGMEWHALTVAWLLLVMGAMGKSAQLGLHTWLPDAMEGPTPVSALIHAATMVTAGVFLICRMSPVFEFAPVALAVVTVFGGLTAFVAATIGLTQWDIKRIIAYSTMSQLGYMFFAAGVGAYAASMFHLFTHAFFKALLFLCAGAVIHAMSDEQDIRNMGGLRHQKDLKPVMVMMIIGSLALAGFPLMSGFFSKDMVLEAAFAHQSWYGVGAYVLGVMAAFMTAFYSFRLIFIVFWGEPRADEKVMAHIHEPPNVMAMPLALLAGMSVAISWPTVTFFVGSRWDEFWGESIYMIGNGQILEAAHNVGPFIKYLPTVVGLIGIGLAYLFYVKKPDLPVKFAQGLGGLYDFVYRKWMFDELYERLFVKPSHVLGRFFWKSGDENTINRFGPDGAAAAASRLASGARKAQTGYVYHYAFIMLAGIVALATYLIVSMGV
ncbi:MAG: NADH-quinone oxidoreductase subunit L [Alphaproteobacteria bacterium]